MDKFKEEFKKWLTYVLMFGIVIPIIFLLMFLFDLFIKSTGLVGLIITIILSVATIFYMIDNKW